MNCFMVSHFVPSLSVNKSQMSQWYCFGRYLHTLSLCMSDETEVFHRNVKLGSLRARFPLGLYLTRQSIGIIEHVEHIP